MSCSHPDGKVFSVCSKCGELVVPTSPMDYFRIFNLEPAYFIDIDQMQKRFYELSRTLHPDRFQNRSETSLMNATQWFATLNTALSTLKSDVERAEYLFELAHFVPKASKSSLPPDLAEEYFELQEALEEASTPEKRRAQFQQFGDLIKSKVAETDAKRDSIFHEWESAGKPMDQKAEPFFEKAAREINQRAYLVSMARDLENKCQV